MINLSGTLKLHPQEVHDNNYDFISVEKYMTRGFQHEFGHEAHSIYAKALELIASTYPNNADRFQVFSYTSNGTTTKFWLINDETHITALLPSEYQFS